MCEDCFMFRRAPLKRYSVMQTDFMCGFLEFPKLAHSCSATERSVIDLVHVWKSSLQRPDLLPCKRPPQVVHPPTGLMHHMWNRIAAAPGSSRHHQCLRPVSSFSIKSFAISKPYSFVYFCVLFKLGPPQNMFRPVVESTILDVTFLLSSFICCLTSGSIIASVL